MTMKNSKINTTQLCVILLGIFLATRPILENAMQAEIVGNDAVISSIIAGVINLLLTFIVCYVIYKNPGQSFYDIIKRLLGKTITKIIMLMLAFVFFMKLIIVDFQMFDLLSDAIYSDLNWTIFVIPIFLLFAYLSVKGIKTIARCYQFFLPFALVILLVTLVLSFSGANFENLLPLFDHSYPEFFKAIKYLLIQSCEFLFLFTFMENIVTKNKFFSKISAILVAIFVLVISFYVIFTAVLGNIAPFVSESLIKMTQFINRSENYFKIDLFTSLLYIPIIVLHSSFCVYGISYSLKKVFNIKEIYSSVGTVLLLFVTNFIPFVNTFSVYSFIYDTIGIFIVGFVLILPIILVIASFKREVQND